MALAPTRARLARIRLWDAVSAPARPSPATNLAHCSAILSAIVSCGACHTAIYRSYSATGMSQSCGKAGAVQFRESFDRADFTDAVSGVEYRVSPAPDGYRLQFTRGDSDVRVLAWFIGSGRV